MSELMVNTLKMFVFSFVLILIVGLMLNFLTWSTFVTLPFMLRFAFLIGFLSFIGHGLEDEL